MKKNKRLTNTKRDTKNAKDTRDKKNIRLTVSKHKGRFYESNEYDDFIKTKTIIKNSIRVLYKKPKQAPIVKIISLPKLKRAIVKRNLDIIPYETSYIICHNKNLRKYMPLNIVLSLNNIRGDVILINIDKNKREFKGLSQEDLIWYTQDLDNKSIDIKPIKQSNTIKSKKDFEKSFERDFETNSSSTTNSNYASSFEKTLIGLLVNIELSLASLLKIKKEKKKK